MSHFGELVDDNEDSIIATLGLWKPSHEVHFNVVKTSILEWQEVGGDQLTIGVLPSLFCRHHIHSRTEQSHASFESTNTIA